MLVPDCSTNDCWSAFFASRSAGLYEAGNIVWDDDSDPTWTRVGQTLDIFQFGFDVDSPQSTQICLDFSQNLWVRRPTVTGDNWIQVATKSYIKETVMGYAPTQDIEITWAEYDPNGNIYLAVYVKNIGAYCLRNTNYGDNASWFVYEVYIDSYCKGTGSIRKNNNIGVLIPYPNVLWMGLNLSGWSGYGGTMYSVDQGKTWLPQDLAGNPDPIKDGTLGGAAPDVMPSSIWATGCYFARKEGIAGGYMNTIGFFDGSTYDRDGGTPDTGAPSFAGYFMYLNNFNGLEAYVGSYRGRVYVTEAIEAEIGPGVFDPSHAPTWTLYSYPASIRVAACNGTANNYCLFGSDSTRTYRGVSDPNRKYRMSVVFSTQDHFDTNYAKCGVAPWSSSMSSGSIRYDCGGVARNGIAVWETEDPPEPEPPPVVASGWPIWINCQARELRQDPSFDRLYVVAETTWPGGEDTFNQPLLFQFLLSGEVANTYFENQGFLAFMPTIDMGQPTIYSGGITYTGEMEMHTLAPQTHGVLCAGLFDTGKNVFWNEDIASSNFAVLSGWPVSGWVVVGDFVNERATSVQHDFGLVDDTAITHSDLTMVSDIVPTPWDWDELEEAPFSVNYQYREGQSLWVGAEGVGESPPIKYTYIDISGAIVWEDRGGGLPLVQINDITRGQ